MANLVRWIPKIAAASADDIARFGPQAARVRALLEFLPTMSDDAMRISGVVERAAGYPAQNTSNLARVALWDASRNAARDAADQAVWDVTQEGAGVGNPVRPIFTSAQDAALGEVVSDIIDPTNYRTLTNPLATGRAFDIVQRRGAPKGFRALTRDLAERRLLTQPADMVASSRFARLPQKERDALMEALLALAPEGGLADSGFDSLQDIIDAARTL